VVLPCDALCYVPYYMAAATAARFIRGGGSVEPERFGLKRSLAWELAMRRVRETEREKARQLLMKAHGADDAKDIVLEVELLERRVRAVRLPAYIARFTHGETMNADNKIVDQVHYGVVCG